MLTAALVVCFASPVKAPNPVVYIDGSTTARAMDDDGYYAPTPGPMELPRYPGTSVRAPYQCTYYCGQQAPSGCWCDDRCYQNQDCCLGYVEACDRNTFVQVQYDSRADAPNQPGSTTALGTGIAYYADTANTGIQAYFGAVKDKYTNTNFCSGFCGSSSYNSILQQECYCDHTCHATLDCCPDKVKNCGGPGVARASSTVVFAPTPMFAPTPRGSYGSNSKSSVNQNLAGQVILDGFKLGQPNYGVAYVPPFVAYKGQTGGTSNNANLGQATFREGSGDGDDDGIADFANLADFIPVHDPTRDRPYNPWSIFRNLVKD